MKRLHPDHNKGDRWEDKLREVIQAYNYLDRQGLRNVARRPPFICKPTAGPSPN